MNCPHCGSAVVPGARFCFHCGQELPSPHSAAAPPRRVPQTAMPAELAAKLQAASASRSMVGERRTVTLLFCDVKGSTALAEQMDPEAWAEIMNQAFAYLTAPVYRYEGTIARLMGDALLAFFGAPLAHEDDPQRAVAAGLDIVAGIAGYREQLRRERGLDFNVRVGINTGLVMVGAVGSDLFMEYTAMGDAVNLAARMEQTAQPGTVQIAGDTYRLVAPLFDCEPLGAIEVKGKREPVPAFRVLRRKAEPGRLRGLESHGVSSPLVGREAELAAAQAALQQLRHGQGGLLFIVGEAGLGKSRLAAELRRQALAGEPAVQWLEGHTLSFGRHMSYWPFQEILWQWAGITEEDQEAGAWAKLEHGLQSFYGEQAAEVLPYLASLLTLEVRGEYAERVKYLDAESLGRQVFLASRRFFERLAQERPLVLVFEDLHWADESSARLLEHLLPLAGRAPILIVGLTRDDPNTAGSRLRELAAREAGERYREIVLAPLPQAESTQLVGNLLAVDDLSPSVRAAIVHKADGNPFFLEEIIRSLIDAGVVARDPGTGRWRATAQADSFQVPDTVQGVILARVDRLEDEVKHVLRAAAVIGRSFLYRVLQAVEADQDLTSKLARLEGVELIREKQRLPEIEYIFRHALAQQATYSSILLQQRKALHERVGRAIEQVFADRLEEFYGLLAYHFTQAEAWPLAQGYLLKAADQAGSMAADAEALALYQQALAGYTRAFGERWEPVERAALDRKIGEALYRSGQHTQALEHLLSALALLGYPLPTEPRAVRLAIARQAARHLAHRLWPWQRPRPLAGAAARAVEEQLHLLEAVGWIDLVTFPERFVLTILSALNQAEAHGLESMHVQGYMGLAAAFDFFGAYRLAGPYLRRAMDLARQTGNPQDLAMAYQGETMHQSWQGRPGPAVEAGRRSAEAYRQTGYLRGWGTATMLGGETLLYQGELDQALAIGKEIVRMAQDGGDRQVWAMGLSLVGPAQRRRGDLDTAVSTFKEYVALAEAIPDYLNRVVAGVELGQCYLDRGELERGLREIQISLRLSTAHDVRGGRFIGLLYLGLVRAYILLAERGPAEQRAAALGQAGATARSALRIVKSYRPWQAEAERLQGTYEWLRQRPSAAQRWWQRSLASAEAIGQRYDQGLTLLELGRRLGDADHVSRGQALLNEVRARVPE